MLMTAQRFTSRIALVLAGFGVTITGGCSTSAQTPAERAVSFDPDAAQWAELGYRWDWSGFPTVQPGQKIQFFTPHPDILVAHETGGVVTVMEAASGAVRWASDPATPLTRFVGNVRITEGARGDRLIVSSQSEAFVLDVQTGTLIARQKLEKVVNTAPTVVGQVGIYGTSTGEMFGHQLGTGFKVWGMGSEGAIEQSLAKVGNSVGAVTQRGVVTFVDGQTGSLLGRTRIYGGISVDPVSNDSAMFVASLDQSLYAIAETGAILWRHQTSNPLTIPFGFFNDAVVCTLRERGLTSFDAATGEIRWSNPTVVGIPITLRNGRLIVMGAGEVMSLDFKRGTVLARAATPELRMLVPEPGVDGPVYAITRSGVVAKFVPR